MRNTAISAVMMMFLYAGAVQAATINLSDGSAITGDIIKQDSKSIQVNVDGVTMTYYADEIKDIDGQPFGAAQQAAAPAPADQAAEPETPSPQSVVQPETQAPQQETAPSAPEPADTGVSPEKRALILQFINVFGTKAALNNNFEKMLEQIQKQKPEEAQKIRDRVKVDEIIDRLIPVYDRNFTSDDLRSFIAFYSSPEGQKLIHTIPELMKESVQESIKYMREKFPETTGTQ
jgi:uncharacterized protein